MGGVLEFVATNDTDLSAAALTETDVNDSLQTAWDAGGNVSTIYAGAFNKRKISGFTSNVREIGAEKKTLVNVVDIYDSDFGRIEVMLDRRIPAATVLLLEDDLFAIGMLRPVKSVMLPKTSDSTEFVLITEQTLISHQEKASAKITNTAVA